MSVDLAALQARLKDELLRRRDALGRWEGRLSSSALSTATATIALRLRAEVKGSDAITAEACRRAVRRGLAWLVANANEDGGFGDTTRSRSNISTTALCWGALCLAEDDVEGLVTARERAGRWVAEAAGGDSPAQLERAIIARYGKDKTFSVPILMVLALSGRLGERGWRRVPQLPFPLAALPQSWFRFLQLPVVSYAIPALIAIGQVKHHHDPGWNPLGSLLRDLCIGRTRRVLESVQPPNGGFLEATPLTSFVTMSLLSAGLTGGPVIDRGVAFLIASIRDDGSWPIDTNLRTWATTLSVNALTEGEAAAEVWAEPDRAALLRGLLEQQYREVHPYTGAAPGGWAWTELPGGVPDADDSSGALVALARLGCDDLEAAAEGARWLQGLQNRDGGVATFCRGWANLPFDRSSPDISAHAILAWATWRPRLAEPLRGAVSASLGRALAFLAKAQRADGSWLPLWFGNEAVTEDENPTYGTSRVLIALSALAREPEGGAAQPLIAAGRGWLLSQRNPDGGWGGGPGAASSLEETSLALHALAATGLAGAEEACDGAAAWIAKAVEGEVAAAPIGFYFAKLWYFEELYPWIFAAGAVGRFAREKNERSS